MCKTLYEAHVAEVASRPAMGVPCPGCGCPMWDRGDGVYECDGLHAWPTVGRAFLLAMGPAGVPMVSATAVVEEDGHVSAWGVNRNASLAGIFALAVGGAWILAPDESAPDFPETLADW